MTYDVAVIGLGYVGLTLATALANVGLKVLGVEKRLDVVEATNRGEPHFAETGLSETLTFVTRSGMLTAREAFPKGAEATVYIITVGTPLDAEGNARLDMIQAATRDVAANMSDGALIVLRSTVKVRTTRDVVMPILDQSGRSYHVAMCPERTLEGRAMHELRELPQIVGADDPVAADRAAALFNNLTQTVVKVESLEAAEIIKLIDNTYRDVQFAFANEVARVCEAFGVSAHRVITAGKLGYPRTNVALPGLVGGPCLEKDPHILRQSALTRGIDLEITASARLINERQPAETVAFIVAEMERRAMPSDAIVVLLGMAFKGVPETDDLRGAMSLKVLQELRRRRPLLRLRLFDPVIEPAHLQSVVPDTDVLPTLQDALRDAHVGIIANNHPKLGRVPPMWLADYMAEGSFIYDYWNHFSDLSTAERGNAYFAVGMIGESA